MMFYYHVWVRSSRYRGVNALTYASQEKLNEGAIVAVPLRSETVLGSVVERVAKPAFPTKDVARALGLELPVTSLRLADWLRQFYGAPIGVVMQLFLPTTLNAKSTAQTITSEETLLGDSVAEAKLTEEQDSALQKMTHPDTYILHGRTGSGKTRIYTELTRQVLKQGRSALILVPEIGLTSQLSSSFRKLFGRCVEVLHSELGQKERDAVWLRILTAREPLILIGARSALFSPLKDIGLIVVDESHENAYKQEQAPYYHAVRVASELRNLHQAKLILGSATPSVADYYLAEKRQKPIIRLKALAIAQPRPQKTIVVDLKNQSDFSRTLHLSNQLLEAIASSLQNHEQALLYLNRRGTARVVLCQNCGWQATCPHCDLPLTYHGDKHILRCHVCTYKIAPFLQCPTCHNTSLSFKSFGTKAIVDEVQRLFPEAQILRFDTDNLKPERLEQQYEKILNGRADILVGTQIVAKGLDLPRLSTLGIILADSSLYLPDYIAQERTYQLLTQVLGRVGRGHTASTTVIQTYYPESPILKAAMRDDWKAFYDKETSERAAYNFPPFSHILKLTCRRASATSAEKTAEAFKELVLSKYNNGKSLTVEGPAPALYERRGDTYRWQLIVKAQHRQDLLKIMSLAPKTGWSYDIDPVDLL